jgi:2-keto-4-pentenoate hydratase/2-oxohepta-3-ene-1,7-dioic acid hydratase in catechol pathway
MQLCRFGYDQIGVVEGDTVRDVTEALELLPSVRYPLPGADLLMARLPQIRVRIAELLATAETYALEDVTLLSPVANPGKIIAAPVNYRKHLDEARADADIHHQNQVADIHRAGLFLKASSSLAGPGTELVIRHPEARTDHEIELAVVIGRTGDRVPRERALLHVAGYCVGLDITERGPQERSLRKSIDGYSILGPWLTTADAMIDPSGLELELKVNGELRQKANTSDLIVGVADLIVLASSYYTLHAGDVIMTGTPEGVGPIQSGDVIDASISGIGQMRVKVAS